MQAAWRGGSPWAAFGHERRRLIAILVVIGTIYFSTLSANHSEVEDSIWYLKSISYGQFDDQFHPNHLLHKPINYLFYHGWKLLGYPGTAELPTKVINIAAALATLWLISGLGRLLKLPVFARYFCVLATAFSYGFWWYSVECTANLLPMPFIWLVLSRLVKVREEPLGRTHYAVIGGLTALIALLHQHHTVVVGVVGIGYLAVFLEKRRVIAGAIGRKSLWAKLAGRVLLSGGISLAIVALVYLLVAIFIWDVTAPAEIVRQVFFGSESGGFGYGLSLGSLKGLVGAGRSVIGAQFLFAYPVVAAFIHQMIPNYDLRKYTFLVGDFSALMAGALLALAFVVLVLAILGVLALFKARRSPALGPQMEGRDRFGLLVLGAYLVLYTLFNLWWLPESVEFWLSLAPVSYLLFSLLARPILDRAKLKVGMGLFVACLFTVNLFGSILPQTSHDRDYWYNFNAWLLENTGPGDLVVSGAGYVGDGYIEYYSRAQVLATSIVGQEPERQFEWAMGFYQPKRIFFSSSVLSPREQQGQAYLDSSAAREFFERKAPFLTLVHADAWQQVYLYQTQSR